VRPEAQEGEVSTQMLTERDFPMLLQDRKFGRSALKIRQTCEKALYKHNLNYVWIDTCCVNKWNKSNTTNRSVPCFDGTSAQRRASHTLKMWTMPAQCRHSSQLIAKSWQVKSNQSSQVMYTYLINQVN
jgi:hypothetical protein